MAGVELTVGGWFATSIIRNIIDTARSHLSSNYARQSGTADILNSLENSLPRIQAAVEMASKKQITNRGLNNWLNHLKNAAHEAEDVLDDLEAKRIRESLKGKNKVIEIASSSGKVVKSLIFSDKELKGLKSAVDKLNKISMGVGDFIKLLQHEYGIQAKTEQTDTRKKETSSNLDPNAKMFGRDKEINFILDMILNCQLVSSPEFHSDQKPKFQPSPSLEEPQLPDHRHVKRTGLLWGYGTILKVGKWFLGKTRFGVIPGVVKRVLANIITGNKHWVDDGYQETSNVDTKVLDITTEGNPSDVGREAKQQETSNIKSSDDELNSVYIKNWKLPVLPIFGLGGVGKTTIAKMVYNNKRMANSFSLRAWVYVSQDFHVMRIMKEIVLSLRGSISIDTMMNLDTIERELIRTIENKRIFLVLDDVHDGIESVWTGLLSVIGNSAPGSFVLVTTQSKRVAKIIGNMPNIITLDVLEPECFRQLFEYYAFGAFKLHDLEKPSHLLHLEEEELSTLKSIANKIAAKLHGLPLAGVVIGTMLHARLEREYWEDILWSDWWNDEHALEGILPSLGISYSCLESELKQCFIFCSIFPKYYVFERNRLVQMWMAHGFIHPNDKEKHKLDKGKIRLEDVGSKWFHKLVERSFFQATISEDKYMMHDLIRDLAVAVSSNEFSYVKGYDNNLPSSTHHLGIDCDSSNIEGNDQNNTRLRTLILFGNWHSCSDELITNTFVKSTGLRLLDLSYIRIDTKAPIAAIGQLSHLRFVDLSFSGIKLIPDEFCVLWHLQVLDVRGCNFQKLPKGINKLKNLRHLFASPKTVSLISGIGKLSKLQELVEFHVGDNEGYRISELMNMNEITGHLLLCDLQNVSSKEEAATSQLGKKKYLKNLKLKFQYNNDQPITGVELEILEALKPSPTVEILTIMGSRGKYLPGWIWPTQSGLSNLKCIEVTSSWLTILPAFGELPSLEVLSFDDLPWIAKVGDEFYGHSNVVFASLKELTICNMSRWRAWSDPPTGNKSFPHLKKIQLKYCKELIEMPTNFITSPMVELKLINCPNIHSAATILQGMPSLTHLSISSTHENLSISCTSLNSLKVMRISCYKRLHFVGGLKSLVNLRKLVLLQIDEILESFEVEQEDNEISHENKEQCLQFLTYLHLGNHYGTAIESLYAVGRLPSLRTLFISYSHAREYTRDEESWFQQLTSLEELLFSNCQNLKRLPSTLPMLSSMKKLTIVSCPSISSLPEAGLPQNLIELCISGCSELEYQCRPYQGDDWLKISHIPYIHINVFNSDKIMDTIDDYDM